MKFVIDQNAFSPLAEALSGRSKMAGVAAGLRNQAMQQELDQQRLKQDQAWQQEEAKRQFLNSKLAQALPGFDQNQIADVAHNYYGASAPELGFRYNAQGQPILGENGVPEYDKVAYSPEQQSAIAAMLKQNLPELKTAAAMNAYGGDGLDYLKGEQQAISNGLTALAAEAVKSGNLPLQNSATAAVNGRTYLPYSTNAYGMVQRGDTGEVMQTPASVAKISNMDSSTQYNLAGADLRKQQQITESYRPQLLDAQGNNERAKTYHEQIKAAGSAMDNFYKANPQTVRQGAAKAAYTKPPTSDDARLFMSEHGEVDYPLMNEVYQFAAANGYPSVSSAYMDYLQHRNMTSREGSDQIINDAARYAQGQTSAMPFATQYDKKGGVFGKQGSIAYADNKQYYEQQARKMGMNLSVGATPEQNMKALEALAANGAPRDHIEALANIYLPESW